MGRAPCCEKVGLRRGRWSDEEDKILSDYIQANGEGSWRSLPKKAGLLRCGKSCRLRWINYLRCDVKRGNISKDEEDTIIKLHASIGNKWSLIAAHLGGGRTDNEIKNYWNSHLNPIRSKTSHTTKRSRRRSSMKNKKKPLHSNASSLSNNSEKEKEKELEDDCSGWLIEDEGGLLMMVEQYPEMVLQNASSVDKETDDDMRDGGGEEEEEVKNTTSKQLLDNSVWDWDFEGLEGLEEEDNNSMLSLTWPWDDDQADTTTQAEADPLVAHDQNNKKQADAIIAWLLS